MKVLNNNFRRLAGIVEYLVDNTVGIINSVAEIPREPGTPDFFHFSAYGCHAEAFTAQRNFNIAGGASASREIALAKAVGEVVERYCCAIYRLEDFPLTSFNEAPFPCVPPEAFALYSAEQYESPGFMFIPFERDTNVRWAPALHLASGEEVYVPAAMVLLPYSYYLGAGDSPILQPISTGLACHASPGEAAISAICEVIERDAFTITWQAKLGRTQIRVETLSDANYDLVQRFERVGGVVTLLNLTMDSGVPTIMSVLQHASPEEPALTLATSSELDPEQATRKSLEELAHTRRYMKQIKASMPRLEPDPSYENVVDQLTHLNLYCDHANSHLADFIFTSQERIAFEEIEDISSGSPDRDLRTLVERVESVGHQVLVTDLTTPEIQELGLTVCKAVIPGFHPLCMWHKYRALGGIRLWEVPQRLGYTGVTRESGDNPAPHPFP
jgi:ribosomal protein S12 methylthiotransferase accessory factor